MSIKAVGTTDPGVRRPNNDDYVLIDPDLGLFMVADGTRGNGEAIPASQIAAQQIRSHITEHRDVLDRFRDEPSEENRNLLEQLISDAVTEICGMLFKMAPDEKKRRGSGTTLSLLGVVGKKGFIAHVGDSRVYLLRQREFYLLTEDHSLLQEYLKKGLLEPNDERSDRLRKVITRGIGLSENVQVDFQHLDLVPGDQFLVCSDGLHRYLWDWAEVLEIFETNDFDSLPATLVVLANSRGGEDNIGIVVTKVEGVGGGFDPREPATDVKLQLALLEGLPLFSGLDYSELLRLHNRIKLHPVRAGQVIVNESAGGNELYVILSGKLTVSREGRELAEMERGDHFGEIGLLGQGSRSATVTATTPGLLMSIDRDAFQELMRREPAMAVKMLWRFTETLGNRLRKANEMLRELGDDEDLTIRFSRITGEGEKFPF